jgi:hypothetical protein
MVDPVPVDQCDVVSKEILTAYREQEATWYQWLRTDEHHPIWPQIYTIVVNDITFRTFADAADHDKESALHNSLVRQSFTQGYLATQGLTIRRLPVPVVSTYDLLKRIGVITHPRPADGLPSALFDGQGLVMGLAFTATYEAAEQFSRLYALRQPGAGFLKTILLRRIGSSARAGLDTARHLLGRLDGAGIPEEEQGDEDDPKDAAAPEAQEFQLLREVERNLASVVERLDIDPKVEVILHYLRDAGWLDTNGSIIFSQYRTTAEWIAEALCAEFPDEPVALYAGGSASFVQRGSDRRSAGREQIKASIERGDIRLVCATDAACEGLNLQRLGAQVNVDLPWNPSRLLQRKGRVQRIGQVRDDIHVLSLRYAGRSKTTFIMPCPNVSETYSPCSDSSRMGSKTNGSVPCSATARP